MNLTAVEGCVFCKELVPSSMWKCHCSNVKNLVIILRFLAFGFTCFHMEPDLCKKYSAYCVYTLLASLDLPLEPAAASCFTTCWERLSGQFRETVGWFCAEMWLLVCLHNHGFASWPRNPQREQPFELIWNARSCVSTISIPILLFFKKFSLVVAATLQTGQDGFCCVCVCI